jgi:charged multivesicular body protein 2B
VTRDVERDRRELERDEKKLEMEIKKAAKAGNKQACTVLAKQLVQIRKQKTRTYQVHKRTKAIRVTTPFMELTGLPDFYCYTIPNYHKLCIPNVHEI